MKEEIIDIVACTDNNYIMPTGVMMYSVCCNNRNLDIVFHIITGDIGKEGKEKLNKTIMPFKNKKICFYDAKQLDTSIFPRMKKNHYPISAFYRLFLVELLPINLNKVLYLDVDIIVRKSLLPLWNVKMNNCPIAAVRDRYVELSDFSERLGYPKEMGYINSGVLLINLEYWRKHNVINDFVSYMKQHADAIIFADQDIINYVFRLEKMLLPIKYNLQANLMWTSTKMNCDSDNYEKEIQAALCDCVIVHFCGEKPWHTTCRHPFVSTFFRYYNQTLWNKDPLQDPRSLIMKIRNCLSGILRQLKIMPPLEASYINVKPID